MWLYKNKDDGVLLADCPFRNIVAQGTSEEEAIRRFQEQVEFLFETCNDAGALESLLDHRTSLRRGEAVKTGQFATIQHRRADGRGFLPTHHCSH